MKNTAFVSYVTNWLDCCGALISSQGFMTIFSIAQLKLSKGPVKEIMKVIGAVVGVFFGSMQVAWYLLKVIKEIR